MVDYASNAMCFVLKQTGSVFKMMDFVLKVMGFVLKVMNFALVGRSELLELSGNGKNVRPTQQPW